jgi:hypothetical protein
VLVHHLPSVGIVTKTLKIINVILFDYSTPKAYHITEVACSFFEAEITYNENKNV